MKIFQLTFLLVLSASSLVFVECGLDEDWALIYSAIGNPAIVKSQGFTDALKRVILSLAPIGLPAPAPCPAPAPAPVPVPSPVPAPTPTGPQLTPELILALLASQGASPSPAGNILNSGIVQRTGCGIKSHKKGCGCKKNLADFMVTIPQKKPTEKPPRKIVIKLPCAVADKKPQAQCECNSCDCKSKQNKMESSESESIEVKTNVRKDANEVRNPRTIHRPQKSEESSEEVIVKEVRPRATPKVVRINTKISKKFDSNSSE